jgi:protein gp37
MKIRSDLNFLFITKRIHRFYDCIPPDWGEGYDNVTICCTVENQDRADYRLPIFMAAPIKHKHLACEPLLEDLDLSPYLNASIKSVVAGGESGLKARVCDYQWILHIREQCQAAKVGFYFKQTGANFVKDGKHYRVARKYQHSQARKAKINLYY